MFAVAFAPGAAVALAPWAAPALARAPVAHRRVSSSPYPAGATRPLHMARPAEFAHGARAASGRAHAAGGSTGGANAPGVPARGPTGAGPTSTAKPGAKAKPRGKAKKKPKPKPTLHGDAARALVGFEAMQRNYYIAGSSLYEGEPFSYLWSFSQALAATVTMNEVSGVAKIPGLPGMLARELSARMAGLGYYLDKDNSGAPEGTFTSSLAAFDGTVAPPVGAGGTKYYDDNEWVGIELARVYELTHNAAALGDAEAIMAFVMAGWDTNPEHVCPGGVPFSNEPTNNERNTVTDGPGAELAVRLYEITGNTAYLGFAEQAYEWVRRCLLAPNGLYADHIGAHGAVTQIYWSYNQGSMIGAGALLYQATHNGAYLWEARQTAKVALAYYTPQQLASEIPFFVAVYFRNMLYLDAITHDPPGARLAQPYVDYAWQHLRLTDGLYVYGSPPSGQLLVQSAIVQIYGLLSSPPATYF